MTQFTRVVDGETELVASLFNDIQEAIEQQSFNVLRYGALGDGATDDTAAIAACVDAAHTEALSTGAAKTVVFDGSKSYVISRRVGQTGGGIYVRSGVNLDGNGAKLILNGNCDFIIFKSPLVDGGTATTMGNSQPSCTITADVSAGDTQLTVDDTTGFAVADEVFVRFNDNAYDSAETKDPYFAKVLSVDSGTTFTLDRPAPDSLTVASTEAGNRTITLLHEPISDVFVRNFDLVGGTGSGNAESGINVGYTRNVLIENISGEQVGTGLVKGGYIENLTVRNLHLRSCNRQASSSKGRGVGFWNAKHVLIDGFRAERFEGSLAFIESYGKGVSFRNLHAINNHPDRDNATLNLVHCVQESFVSVDGMLLEGEGGISVFGQTTGGRHQVRNLFVNTDTSLRSGVYPADISGVWSTDTGTFYSRTRRYSKRVAITVSADTTHTLPSGYYRSCAVYVSNKTGITTFYLKFGASNGSNLVTSLTNATTVQITGAEQFGTTYPFSGDTAHSMRIVTDGTVVSGSYLVIDIDYFPATYDDGATAMAQAYSTGTYTPSNVSTDRAFDANSTTTDELADVLGTLIADLQVAGVIQ